MCVCMDRSGKHVSGWRRERGGPASDRGLPPGCGPHRQSMLVRLSFIPSLPHQDVKALWHSPLKLLQGDCDPQAMAQHIESSQNVCPLHHLSQRPALQHSWAEHVPRLLCQEANVDKDLGEQDIERGVRGEQQAALRSVHPTPGSPHSTQGLQARLVGAFRPWTLEP